MDIIAGDDFVGVCGQKVHLNECPILDGYGINGHLKLRVEGKDY
jgi:hypothetical protein